MMKPITKAGSGMSILRKALRWADGKRIKAEQWDEMILAIEYDMRELVESQVRAERTILRGALDEAENRLTEAINVEPFEQGVLFDRLYRIRKNIRVALSSTAKGDLDE